MGYGRGAAGCQVGLGHRGDPPDRPCIPPQKHTNELQAQAEASLLALVCHLYQVGLGSGGTAGLGDTSPSLLGLYWLLSGRGRSPKPVGAQRPRRSRLAAGAEGRGSAEREANKKDIFFENQQDLEWCWGSREGVVLPHHSGKGRGSWALGQWDRPPDPGMLQRFTKNPLEDSQGTLLSTSLRNRTFPLSQSWEAALVSVFLLALTALNSTISGALGPRPSQFPTVLLHSQPAGLGWCHSWWLPEHL